ncbi:hypothetical protein Pfo_025732 [Paulownia fortunei]|nr:hypothetical protein Pfo_025732 [Paulownia fortunei]
MNYSIFSSFEAAYAELLWKSVRAARSSSSSPPPESGDGTKEINHRSEEQVIRKPKHSKVGESAPRFAPELDGLNCFETLIPY